MPRTAISILLAVLYLLILSCGNPFDHGSKEGTLRIVCTPADESVSVVRADLIVSNASGDPVATAELAMSGKTATGSVSVKAGSGYRVDVYGYDSSNNLSFFGSESDITVAAGKVTATLIGRMGEIIRKPYFLLSGVITGADSVTVTLSGNASASKMVNNLGSYSFTVLMGGNYTVTPTKTGYTFTPANRTFSNVTSSQKQDFSAIIKLSDFSLGSTMDEVTAVQGAPSSVDNYSSFIIWHYGLSSVTFSSDTKIVKSYDNYDKNLNIR